MIRSFKLWAMFLIGLNVVLWRFTYHTHSEWHFFRLNGVQMRTHSNGRVEVLDLRSGKYVPYDVIVKEVKK